MAPPEPAWSPPVAQPEIRRPAPPSLELTTVAWSVGRVLGLYLLACVALTTVLAFTATGGHPGNPANWLRGGVLLAALGLRGKGFVKGESDGESGSVTVGFTPILLLLGVVALAYLTGKRAEQKALSSDHRQSLVKGAAGGAVVLVVLAFLTAVTRFECAFDVAGFSTGGHATVGASILPLFLYGLPLLALAMAAGRSVAHRAVFDLPTLGQDLSARTHGISDWLRPVALQVAVTASLFAAIAFCYGLTEGRSDYQNLTLLSVTGLLGYVVVSANAGLLGTAVFMGISGHAASSRGLPVPADDDIGLFHGDLSGIDFLWLLIPPLVALAVGVRQAYRTPESAWWQGGVASLASWLVLAFFLRVTVATEGGGQHFGMTFGLGLVALGVIAFLYGVLMQLGGRALAPPLLDKAPDLAHALGYRRPVVQTPSQHQLWG